MPGAIIAIDQARPGPSTSSGSPGVARKDLWQSRVVTVRSTAAGNSTYLWTLLDVPPGSAASLSTPDQPNASFTPDRPGSYRVKLITNGGGPGNVQILIAAITLDVSGSVVQRGWRIPAFGEVPGEDNFDGQVRGWSEAFEFIFADLLTAIGASAGMPEVTVGPTGSGAQYITDGTDDQVQINLAIAAAAAATPPNWVRVLPGVYSIASAVTLQSGVELIGAGVGKTKFVVATGYDSVANDFVVGATGVETTGTPIPLTVDAAQGDQTITATAGVELSAVQPDEYLLLVSEALWESTNLSGRKVGEFVRAVSVSTNVLTIRGTIRDSYLTADTAVLYRMSFVENISIRGIEMYQAEPMDSRATIVPPFVHLSKVKNITIEDCNFHNNDGPAVVIHHGVGASILNNRISDLTDNTGAGRFGYGILLGGASEAVVVDGNKITRCRHGIDAGLLHAPTSATRNYGIPRGVVVSGNSVDHATNAAYSTHNEAEGWNFTGNVASNIQSAAFYIRARGISVVGNTCQWCNNGIQVADTVYASSGGSGSGSQIVGNTIRHIKTQVPGGGNGVGIQVGVADNVTIKANAIQAVSRAGIWLRDGARYCNVTENTVLDANLANSSTTCDGVSLESNNNGSTASLSAFASTKVTVTGAALVETHHVGRSVTITGAATSANNGTFPITDWISASSFKYTNAAGVAPDANNGAITYSIEGATDNIVANNTFINTPASQFDRDTTGHMKHGIGDAGIAGGNERNVYRNNLAIAMETSIIATGATLVYAAGNSASEATPAKNVAGVPADANFKVAPSPGSLAIDTTTGYLYYRTATVDTWGAVIRAVGGIVDIPVTNVQFLSTVTAPFIRQNDNTTASATAQNLSIRAQNATGTTSTGGNLQLAAGTGTSVNGKIVFRLGSNNTIVWTLADAGTGTMAPVSTMTAFTLQQTSTAVASAVAAATTIRAQNATGTTSTGGDLALSSGSGTSVDGVVRLQSRGTDKAIISSIITFKAALASPVSSKSANYTIVSGTDDTIVVTAACTIKLPTTPTNGETYTVINAAGAAVIVDGNGINIYQNTGSSPATENLLDGETRVYKYSSTANKWMHVGTTAPRPVLYNACAADVTLGTGGFSDLCSLTVNGPQFAVVGTMSAVSSAGGTTPVLQIEIDGGSVSECYANTAGGVGYAITGAIQFQATGLSTGAHTVKLRAKLASGSGTVNAVTDPGHQAAHMTVVT